MRIQLPAKDDTGATAVEYAMIIAGVALFLVAAMVLLGGNLAQAFTGAGSALPASGIADSAAAGAAADDVAPAEEATPATSPYAGPTPSASYAQNMGNRGTYALPSIAGISYSITSCDAASHDGCDRDKTTFTGTGIKVDNEWSKEHRSATFTVAWTIAATDTTDSAAGVLRVTLS